MSIKERTRTAGLAVLGLCAALGAAASLPAQDKAGAPSERAKGTFDVKVTPVTEERKDSVASGRLTIDKTFHGDLTGTSKGEMWTAESAVKSSGGYVAIEKVTGTLRGRRGSFTLLHQGTMRHGGEFDLRIVVVPDSGTDQLKGLSGTMAILIGEDEPRHSYDLQYALPAP
jgi:hypothetical protein